MPVLNSLSASVIKVGDSLADKVIVGGVQIWPPTSNGITSVGGETSYGGNTSGDDITINAPSGCSTGTYLLAFIFVSNQLSDTQYGATPSGWTRLYATGTSTGRTGWVYSHEWQTGETSYTFEDNVAWGTSRRIGGIIAFDGVDLTTPIDAVATANPYLPAVGTSMNVPSDLTTVTNGAMMVVVADANTSAGNYATPTADPAGWARPCAYEVGPGDGSSASAAWMHLFTKVADGSGLQSGPSWTWTGTSIASHKAWHLALRPANPPTYSFDGFKNDFSGLSATTDVTPANSGGASGDAFDEVLLSNGTYKALGGTLGVAADVTVANGYAYGAWDISSTTDAYVRYYLTTNSTLPNAHVRHVLIRNGTSTISQIRYTTDGKIIVTDTSSGWIVSTTAALSSSTLYRVEVRFNANTLLVELKVFVGEDEASPLATTYWDDNGLTSFDSIGFGYLSGNTPASEVVALSKLALSPSGWIGPEA